MADENSLSFSNFERKLKQIRKDERTYETYKAHLVLFYSQSSLRETHRH